MFSRDNEEGTELDYDIHYLFSFHGLLLPFEWLPNPIRKGTIFRKCLRDLVAHIRIQEQRGIL